MAAPISYSIRGAVAASGICRSTLYELIGTGKLRKRKVGRKTIIMHDDLKAVLEALPDSDPPAKKRPSR